MEKGRKDGRGHLVYGVRTKYAVFHLGSEISTSKGNMDAVNSVNR